MVVKKSQRRNKPQGRNLDGILLLDKPIGITSNQALQQVKNLFAARKAGHTGSLDKMASGLLPICFGEATKFSGYLLEADKQYLTDCRLGIRTATGDALGDILEEAPVPAYSISQVEDVLAKFRGETTQIPPMFSALKHQGKRLYELAYKGIEVERQPRRVVIHKLELISFDGVILRMAVHCSKGTYIRTLAEDIGKLLGCGAHVTMLRRTGAGPFREAGMHVLEKLQEVAVHGVEHLDSLLLPLDAALRDLPDLRLNALIAGYIRDGQAVMVPQAPISGMLRLYDETGGFIGVGEILDDGRVEPRRLVNRQGESSRHILRSF
ncbi:MAG: tRNA pseudouridine(55) synthase TruB [Gammaproteobacteria bacterium]|nr:MAG: tRNA pseudouridine(55) synthase TruB [Gammaproteobacteria bacterium]